MKNPDCHNRKTEDFPGGNGRGFSGMPPSIRTCLAIVVLLVTGAAVSAEPFEIRLSHDTMVTEVGRPAIVAPGGEYPSVVLVPGVDGRLEAVVVWLDDDSPATAPAARQLEAGEETRLVFEGAPGPGRYRIELEITRENRNRFRDAFYFTVLDVDSLPEDYSVVAHPGEDGRMVYTPDYRGNRIPDFSTVGYRGGGVPIPDVPVRITLEPGSGDDTERIQKAIDEVGALPPDEDGFRGAVLLKQGAYEVAGDLEINTSGVVLRGEGQGDPKRLWLDPDKGHSLEEFKASLRDRDATVLIATGEERRTVFRIRGESGVSVRRDTATEIIDRYVPVGSRMFHVEDAGEFESGDRIVVERSGNAAWIAEIGMDRIPARPDGGTVRQWEPFDLRFENAVVGIEGNRVHLKHPIVHAVEQRWGGGRIFKYEDPGRISESGIEDFRAVAYWKPNEDGVSDTRKASDFLRFENMKNGWARKITIEHFIGYGVIRAGSGARAVTIEDSSNLVADLRFYRGPGYNRSDLRVGGAASTFEETGVYTARYGFTFGRGSQWILVRGCYTLNNRHSFVLHARTPGPSIFVDCVAEGSVSWSEPHHRWSVGGLYDNVVDDYGFSLMNRLRYGSGHGWSAANWVAWNTRGGGLVCQQPPTAQNWAIGHEGERLDGAFRDWNLEMFGVSDGYWESQGNNVRPASLYVRQLQDRLGSGVVRRMGFKTEE